MILEIAILDTKAFMADDFPAAFAQAAPFLTQTKGYISHEITRCVEAPDRYVLLVRWQTLEDHSVGFRQSAGYQEWKRLTHHFYEPYPPLVQHYQVIG